MDYGKSKDKQNICQIVKNKHIDHIKDQRLSWFVHINRMTSEIMVKKMYKWNIIILKSKGRPRKIEAMTLYTILKS